MASHAEIGNFRPEIRAMWAQIFGSGNKSKTAENLDMKLPEIAPDGSNNFKNVSLKQVMTFLNKYLRHQNNRNEHVKTGEKKTSTATKQDPVTMRV